MQRSIQYLNFKHILVAGLLVLTACKSFDFFSVVENPFDPEFPGYKPPKTKILSGPAMNSEINENNATFTFRHADELYWPNDTSGYLYAAALKFSFRINSGSWTRAVSGFDLMRDSLSFWSFDTLTGIHTLDLHGLINREYTFEVRCFYPTGIRETNWPNRRFSVINAIQGPGITITPAITNIDSNRVFFISANVIDAVDLMGIHLKLNYDPTMFILQNYFVQSDSLNFMLQTFAENVDEFTFIETDSLNGNFTLDVALAAGTGNGVNGTGEILRIIFRHIGRRGSTAIKVLPGSALRNSANQDELILTQNNSINIW